jgi:hypothetical protein
MASNVPSDSKPADTNRAHTNRTLRAKATTAYSRHTVCNRRLPVPGPSGHPTGTSQQMLRVVVEQRGLRRLRKCCQRTAVPENGPHASGDDVVEGCRTCKWGGIAVQSRGGWEDFSRDQKARRGSEHQLVCSLDDRILRRYTTSPQSPFVSL